MKRPHNFTFEEIKAYSKDLLDLYPENLARHLIVLRPRLEARIKAAEAAIECARGEAVVIDFLAQFFWNDHSPTDDCERLETAVEDFDYTLEEATELITDCLNRYVKALAPKGGRAADKIENAIKASCRRLGRPTRPLGEKPRRRVSLSDIEKVIREKTVPYRQRHISYTILSKALGRSPATIFRAVTDAGFILKDGRLTPSKK